MEAKMQKLFKLLVILLLTCLFLGACSIPGIGTGGGNEEEENEESGEGSNVVKENLICDSSTTLYLVYDPEKLSSKERTEFRRRGQ